jgi:hypothetical protein
MGSIRRSAKLGLDCPAGSSVSPWRDYCSGSQESSGSMKRLRPWTTQMRPKIMAMLERRSLTIVAIARRLTTLRNADSIIVMRQGRVVQVGAYEELSHSHGQFRDLLIASQGHQQSTLIDPSVDRLASQVDI